MREITKLIYFTFYQTAKDKLCLWYYCDRNYSKENIKFYITYNIDFEKSNQHGIFFCINTHTKRSSDFCTICGNVDIHNAAIWSFRPVNQNFITDCKDLKQFTISYISTEVLSPFIQIHWNKLYLQWIILFCAQSAEIWDTQCTFIADLSITHFWGINNAPYPIHLNTAFMSFVNRLLDKPCFTSLLILKASSMFCKTKLCNLLSLIFERIKKLFT